MKEDLPLSVRVFRCERCGMVLDRDFNASLNLQAVAVSSTETLNACLETGSSSSLWGAVPVDDAGTEQEPV